MESKEEPKEEQPGLLGRFIGRGEGTVTTWMGPEAPAIEGTIRGRVKVAIRGKSIMHRYRIRSGDVSSRGMMLLGEDIATGKLSICWTDTFHTSGNLMLLHADDQEVERGFSVTGRYAAGDTLWGWRITHQWQEGHGLQIKHHNITPDGAEALALHIQYGDV